MRAMGLFRIYHFAHTRMTHHVPASEEGACGSKNNEMDLRSSELKPNGGHGFPGKPRRHTTLGVGPHRVRQHPYTTRRKPPGRKEKVGGR